MTRTFAHQLAVREKTPLLIGLSGPSSSGKTYSALRLATGIQRVVGGDIFGIDTEARRMLHYAEKFKFQHVPFGAPFSSLDYLDAISYCIDKGARTIVVDSFSHEHEGPGGLLEWHQSEVDRLSRGDAMKAEKVKMLAWAKPKAARRKLINSILQLNCNFIFCFRAKEKLKVERGKEPTPMGYQPIAGEEFIFEQTLNALLLPGANGFPTWHSNEIGERATIKLPGQFASLFDKNPQLSEDIGQELAMWAAGASAPKSMSADELVSAFVACSDAATHRALEESRRVAWSALPKDQKPRVKAASDAAKKRIEDALRAFEASETDGPEDDFNDSEPEAPEPEAPAA